MPNTPLSGIMIPAVTTFDQSGELKREPFQQNLQAHFAAGVSGALIAGSNGEAALLDDTERATIAGWAREVIPKDKWLLMGIGGESTRQTINRAKAAKEQGADAALVVSPHYYLKRTTEDALFAHYSAVADASPLPILMYNIPVYAHLVLSPALVARLAVHDNIIGLKDSAGNLPMLKEYIALSSDNFRVLSGSGGTFAEAFRMGAAGAILAIALFAGKQTLSVLTAHEQGNQELVNSLQTSLLPLVTDIAAAYGPVGVKYAMDLVGLSGGIARSPLQPLSSEESAIVRTRLESSGLIPA